MKCIMLIILIIKAERNLQKDLDTRRTICRNHKSSSNHTNYQNTRSKLKKSIKETKASFLRKALSYKQPAKVWDTVP